MRTELLSYIGAAAIVACLVGNPPSLEAQTTGAAADKVDAWRKANEEFLQAEKLKARKSNTGETIQSELAKLAERKSSLERELQYSRSKLDNASKQFGVATRLGAQDEIEKWRKEVASWESRIKAAQADLAKIDSETEAAIKNLQKSFEDTTQSAIILPGETMQLFVLEDETFNGLYQVREGGYIVLPRIGRIQVAGKDLAGVEKSIKEALESTQLRQGTVMVERARGIYAEKPGEVIYLAGEFQTPGPMRIPEGFSPTIVTTILRAGGLTRVADLTRVKLLRLENGKALVEEVNVQAILDGSGLPSDLALNSGDIIVVPAFSPIVYVTGNVGSPGILQLTPDEELTAYSAILRSGGFARFANRKKVYVMRDRGNGEKTKIPVNIKEVQSGKQSDIVLQGLDIVVVPESWFSW